MLNRIFTILLLTGIVLIALALRFYSLGQVPAGFHGDEAAYGYNAYSLLLTGKDEYGVQAPLVLKSFGEYKPALYAYLTIPWVGVFDLTPIAVRMTSAIFGVLSVVLLYFLVDKLFRNQKIALVSSFLLAISPWHLNLSRTTSEVVVSIFFILLLVYSFLHLKEKFNLLWFGIAIASGVLAVESYTASRFFVILLTGLFVFLPWINAKKFSYNPRVLGLLGIFVAAGILISVFDSASRFNQISITSTPETQLVLEEQIREDQSSSPLVTRIFHNKVVNYARTIAQNYGQYFTLDFLALKGGEPDRMETPNMGLFYLWQIPFLLIGLHTLLRKRNEISYILLSWWFLLLLPAAFTFSEVPNVYRTLVILPPMMIVIAIGLVKSVSYLSSRKRFLFIPFLLILVVVAVWEFLYYQHQYNIHQELHQPWSRGYAYKPLAETLQKLSSQYKKIVITKGHGSPYIYLLFFNKYDPKLYQSEGSPLDTNYKGFSKYIFVPDDCLVERKKSTLYVTRGDCKTPKHFSVKQTILWQDGNPAFKLMEYTPSEEVKGAKVPKPIYE